MNISQIGQAKGLVDQLAALVATYKATDTAGIPNYIITIPDATGTRHSVQLDLNIIKKMLQAQANAIVATLQSAGVDTTGWDA